MLKLISAKPIAKTNWASGIDLVTGRPIENPDARYGTVGKPFLAAPAPIGAHSWQPMSFSPATGLVYLPVNDIGFGYIPPLSPEDASRKAIGWCSGCVSTDG